MKQSQSSPKDGLGAILLCGGRSSRMGKDKANLPFGGTTFFLRILSVVETVARHVVVVAAKGQELIGLESRAPQQANDLLLPQSALQIMEDPSPFEGPLAALGNGLVQLPSEIDRAFVTSCDIPNLNARWIEYLDEAFRSQPSCDVVLPVIQEHDQLLCGIYRKELFHQVAEILATGSRRLRDLLTKCDVKRIAENQLVEAGLKLEDLRNVNTPEELKSIRRDAR